MSQDPKKTELTEDELSKVSGGVFESDKWQGIRGKVAKGSVIKEEAVPMSKTTDETPR